jgi:hypothetical protein
MTSDFRFLEKVFPENQIANHEQSGGNGRGEHIKPTVSDLNNHVNRPKNKKHPNRYMANPKRRPAFAEPHRKNSSDRKEKGGFPSPLVKAPFG